MGVEQRPALSINFKDLHLVLKESDLARASMIFYYITRSKDKKEGSPLNDYVTGLSFLAKNDIHLRLELNAFSQFYLSLKNAFLISTDWNGKTDFIKSVLTQFSTFGKYDDMENYLRWGEEIQTSPTHIPSKEITLTEVYGMKQIAELYFLILSKRFVDSQKKNVP